MPRVATAVAVLLLLSLSPAAFAAPAETAVEAAITDYESRRRLEETVVTPTRGPSLLFDSPRAVTVVPGETIRERSPRHFVQTISEQNAGIVMDVRTGTTGDPVMRGFAGFNILALVDGNTLSTLWGEGGFGADDQYRKVDPDVIERIEIVHGPHSVLYGSNALGGVINLVTRSSPIDYTVEGFEAGGRIRTQYHSVNDGLRARLEAWGATPDFKFLVGTSRAHYHDARRGGDGMVLDPTSGKEQNFDARFDYVPAPGHELTATFQRTYGWALHRYYRPTQDNRAERLAVALSWTADELFGFMEPFTWRLYYQKKRDERTFFNNGREGYAETHTYSTDLFATTPLGGRHLLTYGVHAHVDDAESPDDEQFTYTNPPPTRADAPNSRWANYAVYLHDEWEAVEERLILTGGLRFDAFVFNSEETAEYQPAGGDRDADFFRDVTTTVTGGLGATLLLSDEWRLLGSWSRGFRQFAPNFGFRQLGNGVLVPNQLLDPVTSDNFEVGARVRTRAFEASGFVYYSRIHDWQAVRPATWDGQDWFDFDEDGIRDADEDVVQQSSVNDAWVSGVELSARIALSEIIDAAPAGWSLRASGAWNYGKVSDGEYFRHTQPARAIVGLRWDDSDPERAAFFELVAEMVGKYDRLPTDRLNNDLAYRRDAQDGSSPLLRAYGGVPGYTIFSAYAGMNLCDWARLTVGIENIGDKKYRQAHSRMDSFGLNVIVGLDVTF